MTEHAERASYVSTGQLPPPAELRSWVDEAHVRYRPNADGEPSQVYAALVPGDGPAARWQNLCQGLSRFAGRDLSLHEEVFADAMQSNARNRAIGRLLESYGRLGCSADEAVDLYTRQCSLIVNARDLAVMGATLADGGVNPIIGERVVNAETCHYALAVMVTAGLYETSGDWLYDVAPRAFCRTASGLIC